MDIPKISSLSSYIAVLPGIKTNLGLDDATLTPWYRGQSTVGRPLTPSMYRCEVSPENEREMIRDFKIRSRFSLDRDHAPHNDIDWLFMAQHHGLPTRILDWSENPLAALFFSVENFKNEKDGEIFALNAWRLNLAKDYTFQSVPITEHEFFQEYVLVLTDPDSREPTAKLPMAFRPSSPFKRSADQSGVFTIHGSKQDGIEKMELEKKKGLIKLTIASEAKLQIFSELNEMNINRGTMYGDLDSIAKSIHFRYRRKPEAKS